MAERFCYWQYSNHMVSGPAFICQGRKFANRIGNCPFKDAAAVSFAGCSAFEERKNRSVEEVSPHIIKRKR